MKRGKEVSTFGKEKNNALNRKDPCGRQVESLAGAAPAQWASTPVSFLHPIECVMLTVLDLDPVL
jgi:hypothetical protein